ncbi:MAG TPA: type II secretion system minor pseudopilin GspJ [Usitatibacter sp.]|nr:type II secretion system minor pseudopilin GspJ [Usitatibacter sp.]
MSRASRGFTLVELLVALAIFAVLSGFAYRGLTALLTSRDALEHDARKWRDAALFVGRFERDVAAAIVRPQPSKGASGAPLPAVSSTLDTSPIGVGLSLTRCGSPLQDNALAAPQRIAYRLNGDRVERLSWAGVDAAPREQPAAVTVLAPVRSLAFRFMNPVDGQWLTTWPAGTAAAPAAVEVTVELASGERIVRLVDLTRTR